ncbi:hypothetical protein TSMEX_010731 [Taenia solium]|eukprot:TsM_000280200 transcript=TsM_000280200 gene=TsM_000280200
MHTYLLLRFNDYFSPLPSSMPSFVLFFLLVSYAHIHLPPGHVSFPPPPSPMMLQC